MPRYASVCFIYPWFLAKATRENKPSKMPGVHPKATRGIGLDEMQSIFLGKPNSAFKYHINLTEEEIIVDTIDEALETCVEIISSPKFENMPFQIEFTMMDGTKRVMSALMDANPQDEMSLANLLLLCAPTCPPLKQVVEKVLKRSDGSSGSFFTGCLDFPSRVYVEKKKCAQE